MIIIAKSATLLYCIYIDMIFFHLIALFFCKGQPNFDAPADGYVSRTDMKWRLAIPGWRLDNTRDEYYAGAICEKHRTLKT